MVCLGIQRGCVTKIAKSISCYLRSKEKIPYIESTWKSSWVYAKRGTNYLCSLDWNHLLGRELLKKINFWFQLARIWKVNCQNSNWKLVKCKYVTMNTWDAHMPPQGIQWCSIAIGNWLLDLHRIWERKVLEKIERVIFGIEKDKSNTEMKRELFREANKNTIRLL